MPTDIRLAEIAGFPAEAALDWTLGKLLDRAQMVAQFDVGARTLEMALHRALEGVMPVADFEDDTGRIRWLAERDQLAGKCRDAVMNHLKAHKPERPNVTTKTPTKPKTKLAKALPDLAPVPAPAPEPPVSDGVPATEGKETHERVAVDLVRRCPFNVRKHFDAADVAGLGESIRADGLKDPLLVRPCAAKGSWIPTWDEVAENWADLDHYELSDGERRLRAILWIRATYPDEAAKWDEVPVIVRPMTDEQVRAVMLVSREQSRDLLASELIAGYAAARAGLPDDAALAAKLGRTVGHVRSVLRLGRLPKWFLAAVDAGVVPRSTAELVARIPGAEAQRLAAACVFFGTDRPSSVEPKDLKGLDEGRARLFEDDGGPLEGLSYRQTEELIEEHFQVELKTAPFSRKALDLIEGVGTCGDCPKRAGNDADAVAAGTRADVCLDPPCYRAKEEAWNKKVLAELKQSGRTVLPQKTADGLFNKWGDHALNYGSPYVELDATCYDAGSKLWKTLLKGHVDDKQIVVAVDPDGKPRELVKKDVAQKVLKDVHKIGAKSTSSGGDDSWKREQRKRAEKAALYKTAARAAAGIVATKVQEAYEDGAGLVPLLQKLAAALTDCGGADACRMVTKRRGLEQEKAVHGRYDSTRAPVQTLAAKLDTSHELLGLIAEIVAAHEAEKWCWSYYSGNMGAEEKAFWKTFGVDRNKLLLEAKTEKESASRKAKPAVAQKSARAKAAPQKTKGARTPAPKNLPDTATNDDEAEPAGTPGKVLYQTPDFAAAWRSRPLGEAGEPLDDEFNMRTFERSRPKLEAAGVKTLGDLADRLAKGETFGLGVIHLENLNDAVRYVSIGRHPRDPNPVPQPVVLLSEVDDLPDVIFDALFERGITSIATLLARMAGEQPQVAELPLRNRLTTYLVTQLDAKMKPAENAAAAIAKRIEADAKTVAPVENPDPPEAVTAAPAATLPDLIIGENLLGVKPAALDKAVAVGRIGTDAAKVKSPQNVGLGVAIAGTRYVCLGTETPGNSQPGVEKIWTLYRLHDPLTWDAFHPAIPTRLVPGRTEPWGQHPGFYSGVRVTCGGKEYVIGPDSEKRRAVLKRKPPPEFYGWDVTYETNDYKTLTCHYVGTEAAAKRKALLRPNAKKVVETRGFTEEQYVRAFGRGRS